MRFGAWVAAFSEESAASFFRIVKQHFRPNFGTSLLTAVTSLNTVISMFIFSTERTIR
jgi:hypothetical protein